MTAAVKTKSQYQSKFAENSFSARAHRAEQLTIEIVRTDNGRRPTTDDPDTAQILFNAILVKFAFAATTVVIVVDCCCGSFGDAFEIMTRLRLSCVCNDLANAKRTGAPTRITKATTKTMSTT